MEFVDSNVFQLENGTLRIKVQVASCIYIMLHYGQAFRFTTGHAHSGTM